MWNRRSHVADLYTLKDACVEVDRVRKALDYVATPKDSGYRAIHLDVYYEDKYTNSEDRRVEIRLRTRLQHEWADRVEDDGRRLDLRLSLNPPTGIAGGCEVQVVWATPGRWTGPVEIW